MCALIVATSGSPAGTMKLVGGELCLDFVNSVGGRVAERGSPGSRVVADKLAAYADLVAWSRHTGSVGEADARRLLRLADARPTEAGAALGRALLFREALHRTLLSLMLDRRPGHFDLSLVNVEIAAARGRERLVPFRDGLRWDWPDAGERLESPLWPVSRSAAELLASGDLSRLRQCGGDRCGWLFLDRSRNRSRQWCTMEDCGNLAKVRRFRQRRRDPSRARSTGRPTG